MTTVDRWSLPGGPTLGVRRWGDGGGLPVVLVHGLSASSAHYGPLGERLAAAGWDVAAIDLRGHGASDRMPDPYVIEHYAADVEAFLAALGRPAVLVGHSLGGAIAVYLAGSRPDLVRGALAEDPPLFHGDPEVMAATPYAVVFGRLESDMRRLQADATDEEIRSHLAAQATPGGGTFAETAVPSAITARIESFRACDPDVWEPAITGRAIGGWDPLRPVEVPLVILRADPALGAALTPDEAARFAAANPAATVVEVPGAPHGIREHAATTDRYLAEFDRFLDAMRMVDAHARSETIEPVRVDLDMAEAYATQHHVISARLARGERRIGWKLGYTSLVMREQMGVDEPNFGPLTDGMLVGDGGDVAGRFTQPRVEPEVALRFATDVPEQADRDAVLAAVASAHAALEIVDSVWTDYRFTIADNTADGSSAAGVVLGEEIPLDRIADVAVTLTVDGEPFGSGHGRDASGHPADGVVWLARQLASRGERIAAGDVVITGGLTAAATLAENTEIAGVFDRDTVVRVRRLRS